MNEVLIYENLMLDMYIDLTGYRYYSNQNIDTYKMDEWQEASLLSITLTFPRINDFTDRVSVNTAENLDELVSKMEAALLDYKKQLAAQKIMDKKQKLEKEVKNVKV